MTETTPNTDRSLEIIENVELLIGCMISNSPLLQTNELLNNRATSILKQIKSFRFDFMKTYEQ